MGLELLLHVPDQPMLRGLGFPRAALLAILLVSSVLHAAEVRVTITDHSSGRHCLEHAVVSAVLDDGKRGTETAQREGSAVLPLDGDGAWRVRAVASGAGLVRDGRPVTVVITLGTLAEEDRWKWQRNLEMARQKREARAHDGGLADPERQVQRHRERAMQRDDFLR